MIYYIGWYVDSENEHSRQTFPASNNKMKYIFRAMNNIGMDVQVVSCSRSVLDKGSASENKELNDGAKLRLFRSFGMKNAFTKALDRIGIPLQLLIYLYRNVTRNDVVVVYHSLAYCNLLRRFFSWKRCNVILEMEEVYADVTGSTNKRKRELAFAEKADGYIFPTQLLNDAVNTENKPSVIVHGTYEVEPQRDCGFDDDKIHVVYAGTLDPRKGGAMAAVAAAEFLDEDYHVHILGFGSEKEVENIETVIANSAERGRAVVTYDGLLSGEEYIRFIQSCDIGLSTQNPDAAFNATSFPSKVLSYLANGLKVVSVCIPVIEKSMVNDILYTYDQQNPREIAKAIMRARNSTAYDSRKRLDELDAEFVIRLTEMIEKLRGK